MKWLLVSPAWILIYFLLLYFSFYYLIGHERFGKTDSYAEIPSILGLSDIIPFSDSESNRVLNEHQDIRIQALRKFFTNINSPLIDYTEEIVKNADIYGIDYALVPAISMQESNACKVIPNDSYNCWGFGIYGSKVTRFSSYAESIAQVSKTIKETYIKKGLTNPTLLEDKWTPQSRGTWSYAVTYYISLIHNLEKLSTSS